MHQVSLLTAKCMLWGPFPPCRKQRAAGSRMGVCSNISQWDQATFHPQVVGSQAQGLGVPRLPPKEAVSGDSRSLNLKDVFWECIEALLAPPASAALPGGAGSLGQGQLWVGGGCCIGSVLSTLKLPSPPCSDLQKAALDGISLDGSARFLLSLLCR